MRGRGLLARYARTGVLPPDPNVAVEDECRLTDD